MLRALVLSLIILATVTAMLPAGDALVEAARRASATEQRHPRRRHTRAWWRHHRAHLRRQHALAADRRKRRWAIRRRAVSLRRDDTPRVTLPEMLKPTMELPSASPSSLASIPAIEAEIAAPKFAPKIAPPPQPAATPQLAHAPQPTNYSAPTKSATKANAVAMQNRAAATRSIVAAPPQNAATPNSASAFKLTPSIISAPLLSSRALSPLAPLASAPHANTPLVNAPLPNVAAGANANVAGAREPHKFSALPVPQSWQNVSSSLGGEYKFSLRAADGRASGVAVWSRVNLPAASFADRRNKSLAGVAHASLRRTVIDRMLLEGGWVVNDFERVVAGQKVFVVVAQSDSTGGARRSWTYYFIELDGQLFSLATTTPAEYADAVATEAGQTLDALVSRRAASNAPRN
jgi:hypothetical protein